MARLSVTVIARDEARDLPACLLSVAFADEVVVVVDERCCDGTADLARAAGARVFVNPWTGPSAQKAFALSRAEGDWVLNLDADERCSPRLREALPAAIARDGIDGYRLRFQTFLMGRRVRFGGFGNERHLRLFRRERAHYPEAAVHEGVRVLGRVAKLDAPVVHHPYDSLEDYFDKFNRYTGQVALGRHRAGRRFSPWCALRWPLGFLRRWLFQLGFLDGYAGWLHASLSGLYDFVKYAKLDDLERSGRGPGDEVRPA